MKGVRAIQVDHGVERRRKRDSIDKDQDKRNMIVTIATNGKKAMIDIVDSDHMIVTRVIASLNTIDRGPTTTPKLLTNSIRTSTSNKGIL